VIVSSKRERVIRHDRQRQLGDAGQDLRALSIVTVGPCRRLAEDGAQPRTSAGFAFDQLPATNHADREFGRDRIVGRADVARNAAAQRARDDGCSRTRHRRDAREAAGIPEAHLDKIQALGVAAVLIAPAIVANCVMFLMPSRHDLR